MRINVIILQRIGHFSKALSPRAYPHGPSYAAAAANNVNNPYYVMMNTVKEQVNSFMFLHNQSFLNENYWQPG